MQSLRCGHATVPAWHLAARNHRGDGTAVVEFVARYRVGGAPAQRLHEVSRFARLDGRWMYVDGGFQ